MRNPFGAKLGLVRAERPDDGFPVHSRRMALSVGEFKPAAANDGRNAANPPPKSTGDETFYGAPRNVAETWQR
jgi:hypothetical protein